MQRIKLIANTLSALIAIMYSCENYADNMYCDEKLRDTTKNQVYQLIHWLNSVGSFERISQQDISNYFAPAFKYTLNGTLGAVNASDLHERYIFAKNYYKSAFIQFPIKDILIDCNKAALQYTVTFVDQKGIHRISHNTSIVKYNENGKIDEFSQSYDIRTPLTA